MTFNMDSECDCCGSLRVGDNGFSEFVCFECGLVTGERVMADQYCESSSARNNLSTVQHAPHVCGKSLGSSGEWTHGPLFEKLQKYQKSIFPSVDTLAYLSIPLLRMELKIAQDPEFFMKLFHNYAFNGLPLTLLMFAESFSAPHPLREWRSFRTLCIFYRYNHKKPT